MRREGGAGEGGRGGEGEEDCLKARERGTQLSVLKTGSEAIRSGDG